MTLTTGMILAAGLGTRMRPLTLTMPKPLIPVAGKALIDWNLDWLEAGGIQRVVINSSYLADQLEAHVAGRAVISREAEPPLETGGGVAKALPLLAAERFVTMNADAILPPVAGEHPLKRMAHAWGDDLDFLLLVVPVAQAIGWQGNGDFVMDEQGRLRRPQEGEAAPYIFTGVEVMHRRAFVECPLGAFSLSALWTRAPEAGGWFQRVRGMRHDGPWLNVGDLHGLAVAEQYYSAVTGKRT